jgi:hypothetical protein
MFSYQPPQRSGRGSELTGLLLGWFIFKYLECGLNKATLLQGLLLKL